LRLPDFSRLNLPPAVMKIVWFVGLWAGGVATVTVLAYGIRLLILPS